MLIKKSLILYDYIQIVILLMGIKWWIPFHRDYTQMSDISVTLRSIGQLSPWRYLSL